MSSLDRWLRKSSFTFTDRAERRSAPALAAYHWAESNPKQDLVENISSSGAYLLTEEKWDPGQVVSLTLQRKGPLARLPEDQFSLQAKAVRRDKHGVGVAFMLPQGGDLSLWQDPAKTLEEQAEPEEILREFRIAAAMAFLRRICPSAAREIKSLFRSQLSNYRLDCAVAIALHAEEMLVFEAGTRKMRAHPSLLLRILEDGSWADSEHIQHFWAGLLATSCTIGDEDATNLVFIDLLSQLTSMHSRIFAAACTRATTYVTARGTIAARALSCGAEDVIQIAGSHDLVKIDRGLEHMADMGLLMKREKFRFFSLLERAEMTPTGLGLELFARCNAHRGAAVHFYKPMVEAVAAD